MAKHVLVVFTNAVEGREEEFDRWYDDVHIADLLKIPGIVSAQRFRLSDTQRTRPPYPWKYLALYEIETDDLNKITAALKERAGTPLMPLTDALAPERVGWYFDTLGPPVTAANAPPPASDLKRQT
jgi:hypothetical protein